jgi:hypothetical protein
MHRFLLYGWNWLGQPEIDHKSHNGLDNRRCNLRQCTNSQNKINGKKRHGCSSKYKGVTRNYKRIGGRKNGKHVLDGRWYAYVRELSGKMRRIGVFTKEADAARAYDVEVQRIWGEFAVLNFPDRSRLKFRHHRQAQEGQELT